MPQTNLAGCGKRDTKHGNTSCIFWCDPKNWACLRNLPPQNTRQQSWGPFGVGFPQKNTRHSKPNRPNLPYRFYWRCSSGHMHSSMICEALDKEHWASHQMAFEAPDSGSGFKLRKGPMYQSQAGVVAEKESRCNGWFTWTSGIAVVHGKTCSYPHLCRRIKITNGK